MEKDYIPDFKEERNNRNYQPKEENCSIDKDERASLNNLEKIIVGSVLAVVMTGAGVCLYYAGKLINDCIKKYQ